ncbi:MAG: porin [Azoarcus sp.]|nr:porin [Azoarcus sp.]
MQKKLIALAVAGLVSAPAFAQSNVTIYGTIDYGYVWTGNSIFHGVDSRSGIESGVSKANRLGFKGVEDLGNGLKAVFVLEQGLNGDKGAMWKGGDARQAYAGLAGGFGTIAFGRQYTPQHVFLGAVDPFANNGLGSAKNVLSVDQRLDNLAAYISPNWSGFSFIVGWTWAYQGDEDMDNDSGGLALSDTRVWAIAPSYTNGGLFVGANYHRAKPKNDDILIENVSAADLFVSYDFGPVKLGAAYGQRKTNNISTAEDTKIRQWLIGATWKITSNDSLLASYTNRKVKDDDLTGGSDAKLAQWAIGYEHALSKRTALYVQYAHQTQNSSQKELGYGLYNNVSGARGSYVGYTYSGGSTDSTLGVTEGYRTGIAVGVRHDF